MKKAFDANVSRARPRVRLGLLGEQTLNESTVDAIAERVAMETMAQHARPTPAAPSGYESVVPDLAGAVKARAFDARAPKTTAAQALQHALQQTVVEEASFEDFEAAPAHDEEPAMNPARAGYEVPTHSRVETARPPEASLRARQFEESPRARAHVEAPVQARHVEASVQARHVEAPVQARHIEEPRARAQVEAPIKARHVEEAPRARGQVEAPANVRAAFEAPPQVIEVQNVPVPSDERDVGERRERLKERLKAVRENPRPEPLPDTVAEAGVLAVERISALQTELVKVRSLNLALTQDLEATRRQSERATEEARLRMDEARRLSSEMEGRAKLLNDLERELGALEGERNEALLALQESRQQLDAREQEKDQLKSEIIAQKQALSDSLSEEERLAAELESAHEASNNLRRSAEALRTERDTLARQVSDLTRERAELLEARKALEAVHRALSQAVSR